MSLNLNNIIKENTLVISKLVIKKKDLEKFMRLLIINFIGKNRHKLVYFRCMAHLYF